MAAVAVCLAGCSDRNISFSSGFGSADVPAVQDGVFKDSNVEGLDFVSGSERGVTGSDGGYTCASGTPIAFSIGNVELGEASCSTLTHPAALTTSGLPSDPIALNIARFLLLLDQDQVPDNGITISDALRTLAGSWPAIDFEATDFEGELVEVMSDLASVGQAGAVLPSSSEAFVHLDASLSCAYSGVFVNSFPAGVFNAQTHAALVVFRQPGSTTDEFLMRVARFHSESQLYVEGQGTVELAALPELIHIGSTNRGRINANFGSPDRVVGGWTNGVAQQAVDREGSFQVFRIGGGTGEYRFTGTYTRLSGTSSASTVYGNVGMMLAGDAITGTAFDVSNGTSTEVSGHRLPGTDQIELTVATGGATGTVTLVFDDGGEPLGLEGTWPGIEGSTLEAVACRLN